MDNDTIVHAALPSAKLSRSESPWSETVMTLKKLDQRPEERQKEDHAPDTEELSSSSAESDVGAREVVHGGF